MWRLTTSMRLRINKSNLAYVDYDYWYSIINRKHVFITDNYIFILH